MIFFFFLSEMDSKERKGKYKSLIFYVEEKYTLAKERKKSLFNERKWKAESRKIIEIKNRLFKTSPEKLPTLASWSQQDMANDAQTLTFIKNSCEIIITGM